jgi:hypothetical protein
VGAALLHPPVVVEDIVVPLLADLGGWTTLGRTGGLSLRLGDVSLSTPTEVTVVAADDTAEVTVVAAGDTAAATPEGTVLPAKGDTVEATPEGGAVPVVDETELVTSAAPRRVVAHAPTPPKEGAPRTLRRSSRNTGKADEHTLLKAECLAKKKNLKGISFSSFSNSHIISHLGRLAINTNTSGVVRIKNLEVDRLVVCANKTNKVNANDLISDDEREERLQEALNHVGGFLNESLFDAENDHILDLSPISRKKKFNNAKKQKTGNLPKKPKTPSKIIIK